MKKDPWQEKKDWFLEQMKYFSWKINLGTLELVA